MTVEEKSKLTWLPPLSVCSHYYSWILKAGFTNFYLLISWTPSLQSILILETERGLSRREGVFLPAILFNWVTPCPPFSPFLFFSTSSMNNPPFSFLITYDPDHNPRLRIFVKTWWFHEEPSSKTWPVPHISHMCYCLRIGTRLLVYSIAHSRVLNCKHQTI